MKALHSVLDGTRHRSAGWWLTILVVVLPLVGCGPQPFRLRVDTTPDARVVVRRGASTIAAEAGSQGRIFRLRLQDRTRPGQYTIEALPFDADYAPTTRVVTRSSYLDLPYRDRTDQKRNTRWLKITLPRQNPENHIETTYVFENVRQVWNDAPGPGKAQGVPDFNEWAVIQEGISGALNELLLDEQQTLREQRLTTASERGALAQMNLDVESVLNALAQAQGKPMGDEVFIPANRTLTRLYRYELTAQISSLARVNRIAEAMAQYGVRGSIIGRDGPPVEFRPIAAAFSFSTSFIQAGVTTTVMGHAGRDVEVFILPRKDSIDGERVKEVGATTWSVQYRLSPGQTWIYGYSCPPDRPQHGPATRYFRINIYTQQQEAITDRQYRDRHRLD
jgi:hypothetical protein